MNTPDPMGAAARAFAAATTAAAEDGGNFAAGVLHGVVDLAAAPPIVQTAANMVAVARRCDRPPMRDPWRATLTATDADGRWSRPPLIGFLDTLDAAADAVHTATERLWRARAAVIDSWTARLYAPPVAVEPPRLAVIAAVLAGNVSPEPTIPTYNLRTLIAEVQGVLEAATDSATINAATAFAAAASAAVEAAQAAAQVDDTAGVAAAAAAVQQASGAAVAALAAGQRWT